MQSFYKHSHAAEVTENTCMVMGTPHVLRIKWLAEKLHERGINPWFPHVKEFGHKPGKV